MTECTVAELAQGTATSGSAKCADAMASKAASRPACAIAGGADAGAVRGEDDPRVALFHESIAFIRECLPKAFFLEESDKLKKHKDSDCC